MSFRSIARALWNTNTSICRWHIASIVVTPEHLLARSSLFSTRPFHRHPRGNSLSFRTSLYICRPLVLSRTAISLTASSAKIVSIRIQMRPRSHHATRHIPLRHSRQFDESDEPVARGGWRSDSSIDTQRFIVIGFLPLPRSWILF